MIEKCHLSGDYFGAYLHQNYLEFFSTIEDIVSASDYLSDADYLTIDWAVSIEARDQLRNPLSLELTKPVTYLVMFTILRTGH